MSHGTFMDESWYIHTIENIMFSRCLNCHSLYMGHGTFIHEWMARTWMNGWTNEPFICAIHMCQSYVPFICMCQSFICVIHLCNSYVPSFICASHLCNSYVPVIVCASTMNGTYGTMNGTYEWLARTMNCTYDWHIWMMAHMNCTNDWHIWMTGTYECHIWMAHTWMNGWTNVPFICASHREVWGWGRIPFSSILWALHPVVNGT